MNTPLDDGICGGQGHTDNDVRSATDAVTWVLTAAILIYAVCVVLGVC